MCAVLQACPHLSGCRKSESGHGYGSGSISCLSDSCRKPHSSTSSPPAWTNRSQQNGTCRITRCCLTICLTVLYVQGTSRHKRSMKEPHFHGCEVPLVVASQHYAMTLSSFFNHLAALCSKISCLWVSFLATKFATHGISWPVGS